MNFAPASRSFRLASSMSPPASCRAFLHSIIGNWVSSRSRLTIAAVISAIGKRSYLVFALR